MLSVATGVPAHAAATTALAAVPAPVQWAVLGDSYTAGVFVGDPSPPLDDAGRDGCDRTTGSYPNLVERGLAADPPAGREVQRTDVSCGNATILEVASDRQTPVSPVQPPEDGWPGLAPQADRAELDARTDLVTIGVGGNSLPFGKLFTSCLLAGIGRPDGATPCRDAYEADGPVLDPESIHDKYDRVSREYATMLRDVHRKAPNAKVITVGYPTIVPEDPSGCDRNGPTELAVHLKGVGLLSVAQGDVAWLHEVTTHLNAVIRAVTELNGDVYVDTATSSEGHDVCRPQATKWVEGICGQAGSYWPDHLAFGPFSLDCSDGTKATFVHPNAAGHAAIARQVEAAIRRTLS
ncbi:SGNH/GDSL hydrolase family protein [Streptomyces sp. NPDC002265]|uniref:SGNH/GDSL hydrolase family protein n=1 Tax=Streptomyces sp. NPDC002265 TaxID=3154415 RepID=UPI00331D0503